MGRPSERVRLDLSGFYARGRRKKRVKNEEGVVPIASLPANYGRGPGSAFLVEGIEHARCFGASPKPARKGLDSRTRVRTPSITGGIGSCATPRTRKIISAASPGASALDVIPKPCTSGFFIHSSTCAA